MISDRKVTESNGVLPENKGLLFGFVIACFGAIFLSHLFADPAYMEWFKVNDTDDPDSLYSKTTDIAQVHWVLVPSGIAMILISLFKMKPANHVELVKWQHWFMGFYFIFTAVAFSGLVTLLLKNVFGRVRPNFYDGVNLWQSVPFGGEYAYLSFPSGHATTAASIAVIVYLFAPRFALFGALFAIWVAITRLGVGAHYPADVLAGLFVGGMFTWLYARSFARKRMLFQFTENDGLTFRKPYGSR